ncbi:MAG: hypothetical protein WCO96_06345 [Actinomycetes bacterium]
MADDRNADALAALMTLAARLRDTAGAVAERADAAARDVGRDADAKSKAGDPGWASADFGALIDFAGVLRESVPPDLRERLSASVHDTLVSARALIDWYLEREAAAAAERNGTVDGPEGAPRTDQAPDPGDDGGPAS